MKASRGQSEREIDYENDNVSNEVPHDNRGCNEGSGCGTAKI